MLLNYTKLIIILLGVFITWCNEAVANPTFDGYRYEKPGIPFDYPTAIRMMPKTKVVTKPTPTKEESVKSSETKPTQAFLEIREIAKPIEKIKTTSNNEIVQNPGQHYIYEKPLKTDDLEKYLNRDDEFIYRLSQNVGKHPIVRHTAHQRLKPKHGYQQSTITNPSVQCGDQNIETLKVKFSERSHHRPLERRLTPYTESIIDKEYFE